MAYIESLISNISDSLFSRLEPYLNFSRDRSKRMNTVNTVCLHWTAGASVSSAINTLRINKNGYHFIVGKDGMITQTVPLSRKAWHAGASYGPNGPDVNSTSIGISMDLLNEKQPVTQEMYQSIVNLILDLKIAVPSLKWITGHQWISPGRKVDPYTFDFIKLIKEPGIKSGGFKIWRTGDLPFPKGLNDCKCLKYKIKDDPTSKCVKSSGECWKNKNKDTGTKYRYSKARLGAVVIASSDMSIDSDMVSDES